MEINRMRSIKIISVILMSLLLVIVLTSQVSAYTIPGTNIQMDNPYKNSFKEEKDKIDDDFKVDDYKPSGLSSTKGQGKEIVDIGNKIIGPIQVIGSLVSVITIIVIGIKYMLGSIEEKAQYKETLGPYFIGAVLVFGITNILSTVYNIATSF